ncbi:MAG: DUF1285 domain-containing protein [Desulfarculus sp.]|nr:MAG: DUF1285 domain-containing protein [Desulfarculus sp.]
MGQDKIDLSGFMPPGWQGKYPPCQIQVDAEGQMSHDGAPLVHPTIIKLIYESVHLEDGRYLLRMDNQVCELEVADTFFVVARVEFTRQGARLSLNDGSAEDLDPASLRLGDNQVIYCAVKGGAFPARFGRAAYYQLAQQIVEDGEGFALALGDNKWPLKEKSAEAGGPIKGS